MDTIADRHRRSQKLTCRVFERDLQPLRAICHWTGGSWDFGEGNQLKWSELQNVPRHIQMLSAHLLASYRALVWKRG
jgi:hypothetical protein